MKTILIIYIVLQTGICLLETVLIVKFIPIIVVILFIGVILYFASKDADYEIYKRYVKCCQS